MKNGGNLSNYGNKTSSKREISGETHEINENNSSIIADEIASKQNALLADLQRLDDSSATRLLLFMASESIESRFRYY